MISKLLIAWCLLALTVTIHAAGLSAMLPRMSVGPARHAVLAGDLAARCRSRGGWSSCTSPRLRIWGLFYWWQKCLPDAESSFYFSGGHLHHGGLRRSGAAARVAAARPGGGIDRHPDVRTVHGIVLRRRQQISRCHASQPNRTDHEATAQRNSAQQAALAAGLRARGVRGPAAHARRAHAALRPVRPGHRAAGRAAESRHRIRGGQDRRCGRRPAQCHARQPDGTGDRADRLARRAIHAGEGVHRRRDRHQHVVHAGRVVSARRTQVPRAGIQPRQRPHAGGPAVPGHGRPADSVGDLASRLRRGGCVHPEVERGPRRSCSSSPTR